jgi:DNA-binding SARP family transcriptional activator
MATLSVMLLGGFQARIDGGPALSLPTRKAQALLAYLALPPGRAHSRDKLAALLWGGIRDESARASLRQALFSIRKALADAGSALRQDGDALALDPTSVDVDAALFERTVKDATPEALQRAADLYGGDLLAGFVVDEAPFEEWLLGERERLRELALEALARLLAHQRKIGAIEPAIQSALRLLALDPLQEPAHRALMRLYADAGRRGAALRQYQQCVSVLARELGVEPEQQTKALYEQILRQPARRHAVADTAASSTVAAASQHRAPGAAYDTTLLGRSSELDTLGHALDGVIMRGEGGVIAVLGEAGIGKSRLVAELAAEAARRGARVLVGRSYESEQILAFGGWVDALRAGRVADDVVLLERLGETRRGELARLLPEAGTAPAGAVTDARPLFESVSDVFALLAERQPLIFILEDVHWADEMSARLLAFAGRRLGGRRVLLVATAREEELADVPAVRQALDELGRDAPLTRLSLGPLSRADTMALVRAIARSGDEAAMARLGEQAWAASEGNPFVAVETVRAQAEGSSALGGRGLALSERVRGVVGRRLDRLSELAQTLAGMGAVIGREFDFGLLQRASGMTEDDAAAGVEELIRRRVLHGLGELFDFTHDRIRDVAYGRLLVPRRKLLHRRLAETLEHVRAENSDIEPLAIGLHYREADVWDRAVVYLRQAAKRAAERGAFRASASCSEEALAALRRLPRTREHMELIYDVAGELRGALIPLGDLPRQVQAGEEMEMIAEALGDRRRLGIILGAMGYTVGALGEHRRAIGIAERGLTLAVETGDALSQAGSEAMMGRAYYALGDYPRTIDTAGRAFALMGEATAYERFGSRSFFQMVGGRVWVAMARAEQGHFAEASARIEEAIAIADRAEAPHERVWSRFGAGRVAFVQGNLERACAFLGMILPQVRTDVTIYISRVASTLGSAYVLAGRTVEALPLLEEAVKHAESIGFMHGHSLVLAMLAEGYLRAGRVDDATRLSADALSLARKLGERGWEAWVLRLHGEIAVDRSPADAEPWYREALTLAHELGMRPLVAHCRLGLGDAFARVGMKELARDEHGAALADYRAMDMTYWCTRAERALGLGMSGVD